MNAKQLKEQEVEDCLNRERTERTPRYPLPKPVQEMILEDLLDEEYDIFETTGLKTHTRIQTCWCGRDHCE